MEIGQILQPRRIDLDSSPLNIQSDTAFFMKGIEIDWLNSADGVASKGELKPLESNKLYCSVTLPKGINRCIGFYFFEEATEGYVVVYNSEGNHLIYRLEGLTGNCRVVYRFCQIPKPAPPEIRVFSGGNPFLAGTNIGSIIAVPGSTVYLEVVGSSSIPTTGNIGSIPVNGLGIYTVLIPPGGAVDYNIFSVGGGNSFVVNNYVIDDSTPYITDNPKDYFSEGRITIKSLCKFLPDGTPQLYKEMLLVNKKIPNVRIVIEDSIATDSFTTPFFTPKNACCGDCTRLIKVGVPTPMADIKVVPIDALPQDAKIQNELLYKMFKFRFKHINGWGQVSEHGKISNPFFNNLSACAKDAVGSPHCVYLETKTPCPEIIKVIIEVQTCALKGDTGTTDSSLLSDWKEYATIDLYDQLDQDLKWYERQYKTNNNNKEFEFFNNGKDIRFKFCNNRECKTIALTDIRDQNPAPINSGSVASIGKGVINGDNVNGYDKLSESDKNGISFELIPTKGCEIKYARIKVYAIISNYQNGGINQAIWNYQGMTGFGGVVQGDANVHVFDPLQISPNDTGGWGQYFPKGIIGFRGILAGTGHITESKQLLWTPGGLNNQGVIGLNGGPADVAGYVTSLHFGQNLLVQEFDFGLVPQGKYYFRIVGHSDTENLENTSTNYLCTTSWNGYKQFGTIIRGDYIKEIYIDTTTGVDYDSLNDDKVAVVIDLSNHDGTNTNAIIGYLYEDRINVQPIELASIRQVITNNPTFFQTSAYTDHNGFFFTVAAGEYFAQLFGYNKCSNAQKLGQTVHNEFSGARQEKLYATDFFTDYVTDLCNRYIISGVIKECGSDAGVAGINVVLGRSKPVQTGNDGIFRVVAHFGVARDKDLLIFSIGASCNIVDCNCNPINVGMDIIQPPCTNCAVNIIDIGRFNVKTLIRQGFEHGSRVPIGIVAHDWLGRHTDIQDLDDWIIDIPTEQEQLDSSYPRIKVVLPPNFSSRFIKYFKYLTFFFSKNPSYSDFFEWSADKVEFIDNAGNVNAANPSKVKIWYRGLNEYNLLRGFKTNTNWNIVDTAGDSRVGDIVEFIQNADGKYLPPGLIGNVQYAKDGTYFLVDYDASLSNLKDGVRFKWKRPIACETPRAYYEYGFTLNFCGNDGIPRDDNDNVITSFFLDGFTSYMLPRQIPVITDVIDVLNVTTIKKEIKIYPFNFEHHSPSDTWGDHCFSGGRVGFKNPYEGRKCDRNQLLLSGALNNAVDGSINYLHYYSLVDELLIDEQGWGGIQAIIVRSDQQIMLICETTTFSLAYNDDRAVVTADGYVKLPSNQRFSRPEKDDGFSFGCQLKDLNTIRRNGSIVMYLDAQKCAMVIHNFATGTDISAGIKSWLTERIKLSMNNDDIYFHGCFDNRGDIKYILTVFNKKLNQFVNEELDVDFTKNESIAFNLSQKVWEQLLHFTPEYFGNMYGENKDTQFFSFKNALPYSHHNAIDSNTKYLNYFGVQCTPVIGVVSNIESTKLKSFLRNEVYCFDQLFILERILTEMGQKSSVYEGAWEWGEGFWKAPYLCDTENVDASDPLIGTPVIDGDTLFGRWLKATYIAFNEDGTKYDGRFFKLTAIISFVFGREKSSK